MANKKYIPTKEKEDIVKLLNDVNMTLEILKMLNRDQRKIIIKKNGHRKHWQDKNMKKCL